MKRLAAVFVSLFVLVPAVAQDTVDRTTTPTKQTRELPEFTEIEVRIAADVEVNIGKPSPLTIKADERILPLIQTEVRDGRLVIRAKESFKSKHAPTIKGTVAHLKVVEIDGAADMQVTGLDNESPEVAVKGAADVHLAGKTEQLTVSLMGAVDLFATKLEARDVSVVIKGAADVDVNVAKSLNVVIAGAGDVHYVGDPKVMSTITGDGSVQKRR